MSSPASPSAITDDPRTALSGMRTRERILLTNYQCPGDILMLTGAVRDLYHAHRDRFAISVDTSCPQLWDFNPYVVPYDSSEPPPKRIECEYPLIHRSNDAPYHFLHGFVQHLEDALGLRIPVTEFRGDIHLSELERSWMSQVAELGIYNRFWIIVAGGKFDFTAKWWNPASYQAVVDHFLGRITFVQCGEASHYHPPLENVINLIGKTDLRQFIRLVYHSVGVLCPVTFAMHAAAAVPTAPGNPPQRACVVVAGGREPAQWEAYPYHRFLSNHGSLWCSANGACWKSRCQTVGDGDPKDTANVCEQPIQVSGTLKVPRCLDQIRPSDVIRAIETYYDGGVLTYNP